MADNNENKVYRVFLSPKKCVSHTFPGGKEKFVSGTSKRVVESKIGKYKKAGIFSITIDEERTAIEEERRQQQIKEALKKKKAAQLHNPRSETNPDDKEFEEKGAEDIAAEVAPSAKELAKAEELTESKEADEADEFSDVEETEETKEADESDEVDETEKEVASEIAPPSGVITTKALEKKSKRKSKATGTGKSKKKGK